MKKNLILLIFVSFFFVCKQASALPDCTPDSVADFVPTGEAGFGHAEMPEVVLGLPGGSLSAQQSLDVVSLGWGGELILEFRDTVIVDEPGPDFIVFENPFFVGSVPASAGDSFRVFAEPLVVSVSEDGVNWYEFPYDAGALSRVGGVDGIDGNTFIQLVGLAGITPTFTAEIIVADDPFVWDAEGTGGVSGMGGDAFDLADLGVPGLQVRFIRLTDAARPIGFAGEMEGADVDAVWPCTACR